VDVCTTYYWDARRRGFALGGATQLPIIAAESFVVDHGRVRGLPGHVERLGRGARAAGVRGLPERTIWRALLELVPRDARWFPRLDLAGTARHPTVRALIRPAPAPWETVVVWQRPRGDQRLAPRRKGPDLELLGRWRREARRHGADEALILDEQGRALEGAYSSLVWWEGDSLCVVPDQAPVLQGITRALILRIGRDEGVPVRQALVDPSWLEGREVWLTSALHGICRVAGGLGEARAPREEPRAPRWQAKLDEWARPALEVLDREVGSAEMSAEAAIHSAG